MTAPPRSPLPGGPSLPIGEGLPAAAIATQRAEVVAELRRMPQSRSDLGRALGLSPSVISRLTHALLNEGMLVERHTDPQFPGRPPRLLALDPHAGVLASMLVTRDLLDMRVVDASGETLGERRLETAPDAGSVSGLAAALGDCLSENGGGRPLLGIGVAVPGVVSAGGSVKSAPDLGWTNPVELGDALRERFGAPVSIENDVNVMMLAEATYGEALGTSDAVLLYLGSRGIGLGILSNGALLTGATHASGEVGQIPLDLTAIPGSSPSLEGRFSLDALARLLASFTGELADDPLAELMSHRGDPQIGGHLEQLRLVVQNTIGVVSLILDPQVVILGGALRTLFANSLPRLGHDLASWLPSAPSIRISGFGEQQMHWAIQAQCWNAFIATGV